MSTQERDGSGSGNGNGNALNAYATLLTRPSYLAGALLLAHTLTQHSPTTPLIIMYTPETMPEPAIAALRAEAKHSNAILHPVEHLRLPAPEEDDKEEEGEGMVAERFVDTWTKLRVFEVLEAGGRKVDRLCFLDADMMVFQDPSPLVFNAANDAYLAGGDAHRLCATHICVCNLDGDAWAPASWVPANCAHTHVPDADGVPDIKAAPPTMSEMNTGTFAFAPAPSLASFVLSAFANTPPRDLRRLKFPDQDFLNIVFARRWKPLSWRVNALKTWRYWHPNFWVDDRVAVLHYIVDKPWAVRVQTSPDGGVKAGYKGDDGVTHGWWWDVYGAWEEVRRGQGEGEMLGVVGRYVAREDGDGEEGEEMRAVGGGAQGFAKRWEGKAGGGDEEGQGEAEVSGKPSGDHEDFGQGPHGRILRKPMLGERGHGRVVRQ